MTTVEHSPNNGPEMSGPRHPVDRKAVAPAQSSTEPPQIGLRPEEEAIERPSDRPSEAEHGASEALMDTYNG